LEKAMQTEILNVTAHGMTCGGCVASVKKALGALPGVDNVDVSLSKHQAEIRFDESKVAVDKMRSALTSAGYGVDVASAKPAKSGGSCCS
jgi:copper chaperone